MTKCSILCANNCILFSLSSTETSHQVGGWDPRGIYHVGLLTLGNLGRARVAQRTQIQKKHGVGFQRGRYAVLSRISADVQTTQQAITRHKGKVLITTTYSPLTSAVGKTVSLPYVE